MNPLNPLSIDFAETTAALLGSAYPAFLAALAAVPPVSLRINPSKLHWRDPLAKRAQIPWCKAGVYLPERPIFTLDPFFHAGGYYVQDASCMLLEAAVTPFLETRPDIQGPLKVLDLCAAPGGKSTHLAQLLPPDALLFSNEVVPGRARILLENLSKWGRDRVLVSQNQPRDFQALPFQFDLILVDAPCSGEGLFRKQPDAVQEWSQNQVQVCQLRQKDILEQIWPCLKPGGQLIYSTCTWNLSENEELLLRFSEMHSLQFLPLPLPPDWGVQVSSEMPLYRAWPHHIPGEGFSLALLQKSKDACHEGEDESVPRTDKKNKQTRLRARQQRAGAEPSATLKSQTGQLATWLRQAENGDILLKDGYYWFWPASDQAVLQAAQSHLNLLNHGLCLAELKGQDLRPDPALALSPSLNRKAFPGRSLDLEIALNYLRGEALTGIELHKTGWELMLYADLPLGWAKATTTHLNNAWPKAWKIRQPFVGQNVFSNIEAFSGLKALPASEPASE
jgi:16S rRNA C967 or C1407 C5-methylase (RsmB/RsmF family)/NOL1/NOP2/fmu family ribosome biogenesis protein